MSKIYEALREAQARRAHLRTRSMRRLMDERRRSVRVPVQVPVFVYGHSRGRVPFHENTSTLEVSADGGQLTLGAPVRRGENLLLLNKLTDQELRCRVVRLGPMGGAGRVAVGVSFEVPPADFWRVPVRPRRTPRS